MGVEGLNDGAGVGQFVHMVQIVEVRPRGGNEGRVSVQESGAIASFALFNHNYIIKVKRRSSPRREVQKALQLRLHRGQGVCRLRQSILLILRRTLSLFLLPDLLGKVLLLFLMELFVSQVPLHHLILLMSRKGQLI